MGDHCLEEFLEIRSAPIHFLHWYKSKVGKIQLQSNYIIVSLQKFTSNIIIISLFNHYVLMKEEESDGLESLLVSTFCAFDFLGNLLGVSLDLVCVGNHNSTSTIFVSLSVLFTEGAYYLSGSVLA